MAKAVLAMALTLTAVEGYFLSTDPVPRKPLNSHMFIGNDFPFDAVRYLNRNKYNSMATFTQVKMTTAVSNQPNNITDPNECLDDRCWGTWAGKVTRGSGKWLVEQDYLYEMEEPYLMGVRRLLTHPYCGYASPFCHDPIANTVHSMMFLEAEEHSYTDEDKLMIDSVAQGTFLETSFDDHSFFSKEVDLDETEPMYESVHFSDYSGPNVM